MVFGATTTLTGKSGAQYEFSIFPRTITFQAKGGVYVMGKELGGQQFSFVYVGQADDLSVRALKADKTECLNRAGVDHIFMIEEPDAKRRAQIVDDLVRA